MEQPAIQVYKRPMTRWDYYSLQFLRMLFALIGAGMILWSVYAEHRDRPSLQWPKVSGTITQCAEIYHSGRHAHYSVDVSYAYIVNGTRFVGNTIARWSPDFGDGRPTGQFVDAHPVRSTVDVYYDPQHPENAVLIPGPDERNRYLIWGGCIGLLGGAWFMFVTRGKAAEVKARVQSGRTAEHPARLGRLPHGFASYEPGCKRKLNVFPDREALDEFLGRDDGKPLQEWQPYDRVIDAAGREYRLMKPPDKKYYDLEPTGQTWGFEQLLEAAEADGKLLKQDPVALRRRLDDVPDAERMAALLKCIDDLPVGPRWFIPALILFLVLFFVAVVFIAGKFFLWLDKFRQ